MSSSIVITDRVYIPVEHVDEYALKEKFLKSIYNEDKCNPCPYRPDRHSEVCDTCPGFLGNFKLYNEKEVNGVEYYGLSVGNRKEIKEVVPNIKRLKIKDKRTSPKFKYDVEFTGTLMEYQVEPCNDLVAKGYGILYAPPRSGKTVMGTYAMCKLGVKTLILANQYDYLTQFYETICGSDTQKALTNVLDIEQFEGKKICGIVERPEDFDRYEICLATYQQFISAKGKLRLDKVKKKFGLVFVDEVDLAPADKFSKVVNAFHAKHRIGCTGTVTRKDCLVVDSKVLMDDGLYKNIQDVHAGDKVICVDEVDGSTTVRMVLETHTREKSVIYEITHEHGTLRCTGDHKVWSPSRSSYVYARDLTSEDSVLIYKDQKLLS